MRLFVFVALVALVVAVCTVKDFSEFFAVAVLTAVIMAGFYALCWMYGMVPGP